MKIKMVGKRIAWPKGKPPVVSDVEIVWKSSLTTKSEDKPRSKRRKTR